MTCYMCVDRLVTALHMASEKGHGGIVELLTKHGAKVNEADHLGQTPLHVAAQGGRVGVARFLLANGADQNIKTTAGQDVEAVSCGKEIGRGEGEGIGLEGEGEGWRTDWTKRE